MKARYAVMTQLVEYLIGLQKKHGFRQEFGLHCHMLRQTFSNMQIENKRNIKNVQHLLGHKDAKTTQLHYNSVINQELDYEGAELLDSLFNDTTLYDGEEHIKKDIHAHHIDNNTFNTETIEQKPIIYDEMTDDELDRQYEELKRNEKKEENAVKKKIWKCRHYFHKSITFFSFICYTHNDYKLRRK